MCRLDHTHVIRTVPDREQDRILVLLDELDHERLLQWRHSTYQKTPNRNAETQKKRIGVVREPSTTQQCHDAQQMTALHNNANSKNDLANSFSSANVRLLPSTLQ